MDGLRRVLVKTVLPIRKKVNKILSQLNFSMSSRISLYYVRLFVGYGVFFITLIYAAYVLVQAKAYVKYADSIIDKLSSGQVSYELDHMDDKIAIYYYTDEDNMKTYRQEKDVNKLKQYSKKIFNSAINPYYDRGVSLRILEKSTGKVLFNDITVDVEDDKVLLDKYSINYNNNNQFIVKDHYSYEYGGNEYQVYFQYNMTDSFQTLQTFILWLIIFYLILVIFVGKFAKRGIDKLLMPIKNMSVTANRLTVNNLHSERLNVEGTKNELKNLAGTVNDMLDRIDLSYESQKQFVSDASHELRTPIAVIQGYAGMLERWGSEDQEVLQESIEAISNEAKSMQDLVEKLLFLSRHDKKTLNLKKKKFNMRPVVEEMVKETKMVVQNRQIQADILEDVTVYGDPQSLKQAVRIFLDNAVKYSKDGDSITVSVKNENGTCLLSVSDTGIGMKKEDINRIFDRFYRADGARNGKVEGHGLGLSIAKLIVLNHAGSIKVCSRYGMGTTFTIVLPDYFRYGLMK